MTTFDTSGVRGALKDTIAAGEYAGAAIRVSEDARDVRAAGVVVSFPALIFDNLGEGFVVSATQWELYLFVGDAQLLRLDALTEAVLLALQVDNTLGGVVRGVSVYESPIPDLVGPEVPASRRSRMMHRRIIRVECQH